MRFCLSISFLTLLLSPPAMAQQKAATAPKKQEKKAAPTKVLKPFLWKLDTATPNYVFGTIHVADKRALTLHPTAEKAFAAADVLMCEIDFSPMTTMKQTRALQMPATEALEDVLSEEMIARIDKRLQPFVGMFGMNSAKQARTALRFRAVAWPLLLPQLEAQTKFKSPPLDMQLYQRAKAANKKVGGIEDASSQLNKLFDMTKTEQQEFVRASLDAMDEADKKGDDNLAITIDHYLRGDGKAFHAYFMKDLNAGGMPKALQKKFLEGLLYDRNKKMAAKIKELITAEPKKSHFFAVGTAHMLGKEKSVLNYLKADGIGAARVAD